VRSVLRNANVSLPSASMKPPFRISRTGQMKKTAKNAAVKRKTNRAVVLDMTPPR
jgi:hypothetical protein